MLHELSQGVKHGELKLWNNTKKSGYSHDEKHLNSCLYAQGWNQDSETKPREILQNLTHIQSVVASAAAILSLHLHSQHASPR